MDSCLAKTILKPYAKTEDKIWVQTGYGLEGILPDSKVGRILDQTFVPARANNNSAQGVVLATYEYAQVITENKEEVLSGETTPQVSSYAPLIYILIYLMIFIIPFYFAYTRKHPKCPYCKGRSDIIKTEHKYEDNKKFLGTFRTRYVVVTYRCRKCSKTFKKKQKRDPRRQPMIFVGGFGGGGGFSGGGFGGGGSGGGGAGR